MKARDFRLHFRSLLITGECTRKALVRVIVELGIAVAKAEIRCPGKGVQRYRALELLDRFSMSPHQVVHRTQLMVGTVVLRSKLDLPAIRSLRLFELLSVEQDPRQTLLSRQHDGVQSQRPLTTFDRQGFLARTQI